MQPPDTKAAKIMLITFGLLLLGSIILAVAFLPRTLNFVQNGVVTKATVVQVIRGSGDDLDSSLVRFLANGSTIEARLAKSYKVGTQTEIVYERNNPSSILPNDWWSIWAAQLAGAFLAVLMAVCLVLSYIFLLAKPRHRYQLWQNGRRLMTQVLSVKESKVNQQTFYRVVSYWVDPANGNRYEFKTGAVKINPYAYLQRHGGLEVVVNPQNYQDYVINTSAWREVATVPPDKLSASSEHR